MPRARVFGLIVVFLWFFIGGIAHFVATEAEMRIVPPYIPWPWTAVIVSGVFELLGAAGILWQPTRRASGLGLMALTVALTPAHIYMLQQPELFVVPMWALWARLPIQAGLMWLIWWSTEEAVARRGPRARLADGKRLGAVVQVWILNDCGNRYLTLPPFSDGCPLMSEADIQCLSAGYA